MKKKGYRDIFFALHGFGPYICWDCGDLVTFVDVHIHHIDEDHNNIEPENLVAAHAKCHISYHARNRVVSTAQRRKNGDVHRGRRHSQQWKNAIAEGARRAWAEGRHEQARVNLLRVNSIRMRCPHCGLESNIPGIRRHLAGERGRECREAINESLEEIP